MEVIFLNCEEKPLRLVENMEFNVEHLNAALTMSMIMKMERF